MSVVPEGMEEVPVQQAFQPAPVEIVVHQAAININKVQTPTATVTLLQFFTPAFTITVKMDDSAAEAVANDLRPSGIEIARVVPK